MNGRFGKEFEALTALAKLMADADTCKRLYEEAGLPLPRPLAVMFDLEKPPGVSMADPPAVVIPRPARPPRSPRGSTDWIYFPIDEAQETSLVLAVLSTNIPVTPSAVVERVQSLRPQVNKGTIANIGSRLEQERRIRRDHNGWMLIHGTNAPEIFDDFIWGSPDAFQKQELAAYRRMVILHVLRSCSDGLQVAQLTRALETQCPWLSEDIPVTKFLVKADMKALADKKLVKIIGDSKKWGLAQ